MTGGYHIEERVAHGLTWQIVLDSWGCHAAEAGLALASVCAQLETMRYAEAVRMHAALLSTSTAPDVPLALEAALTVQYPVRAIEIERSARRAALNGWTAPPRDTHLITLGAIAS
jgi:hypothetical protein